ncbi:MAG: ATP-binding protein [Synergistaceae bacterium]|nr:ATP-binding protein [Synergistaceae bacterium]
MLEDLSAHVLDIAENSVRADAKNVVVTVKESVAEDLLLFSVQDDGKGMTEEFIAKVTDPFTTTRTTRKVGMGLPFLKQSAELCGGGLEIKSKVGVGTKTTATFEYSSVDRPPLGDIPTSVMTLIMGSPEIHWVYRHITDNGEYTLDLDEILEALDGDREMLRSAEVGLWICDNVREGLEGIGWSGH